MHAEYNAKMSIRNGNAREERGSSLSRMRQRHFFKRDRSRNRKEGKLVQGHRCWLNACLILLTTAAFLVMGSYLLSGKDIKGVQHIDWRSSAPPILRDASPASGPLRVNPSNPRYFTDGSGKAILLAGSHTWLTMQDAGATDPPPVFDYDAFLDFVQARGHNFFRTFVWEQSWKAEGGDFDARVLPNIYERTGPGNALDGHPRFDLTQFNQAYFDRIRARVIQAGQRGFYVSLMLFEGFSVMDKHGTGYSPYPGHPYNAANNINGIDGDPGGTGDGGQIQTLNIPAITALQEAYVKKLVDTVNDLDNVLFEICNESEADQDNIDWQNHFIDYIHTYEASKPKQHPVGFTVPWPDGDNAALFDSNAEWVSPNGSGGYDTNPPANSGNKVIIADTDHIWGLGGSRAWAWKSFCRGLNPIFMDPYNDYASWIWTGWLEPDDPLCVSIRANLGYILSYANRMNLAAMTPQEDLCSTTYCLANAVASGAEYLIYLPSSTMATHILEELGIHDENSSRYLSPDSSVNIDLSATLGELSVEWFNPSTGETTNGGVVTGGAIRHFTAPFAGDAVLYLYQPNSLNISDVSAQPYYTNVQITWNTNRAATSQIAYGPSPALGTTTSETDNYAVTHTVDIAELSPDTRYYYLVRSRDMNGMLAESDVATFTTLVLNDKKPFYLPLILKGR